MIDSGGPCCRGIVLPQLQPRTAHDELDERTFDCDLDGVFEVFAEDGGAVLGASEICVFEFSGLDAG